AVVTCVSRSEALGNAHLCHQWSGGRSSCTGDGHSQFGPKLRHADRHVLDSVPHRLAARSAGDGSHAVHVFFPALLRYSHSRSANFTSFWAISRLSIGRWRRSPTRSAACKTISSVCGLRLTCSTRSRRSLKWLIPNGWKHASVKLPSITCVFTIRGASIRSR